MHLSGEGGKLAFQEKPEDSILLPPSHVTEEIKLFLNFYSAIDSIIHKSKDLVPELIKRSGFLVVTDPEREKRDLHAEDDWKITLSTLAGSLEAGSLFYSALQFAQPQYNDKSLQEMKNLILKDRKDINEIRLDTVVHTWKNQVTKGVQPDVESLNTSVSILVQAALTELIHVLSLAATDLSNDADSDNKNFAGQATSYVKKLRTLLAEQNLSPHVFSNRAFRSTIFEIDEKSLYQRQKQTLKNLPEDRSSKFAISMSKQVGGHLRALIMRAQEKEFGEFSLGYSSEYAPSSNARINGVDYVLLMTYLTPLMERYESLKSTADSEDLENRNQIVEAIYAAISADPYTLCDKERLLGLRSVPMPLRFENDQRFYPSDLPVAEIDNYFRLLTRNAQSLKFDLEKLDMLDPKKSETGWHIGTRIVSPYSIELSSLLSLLQTGTDSAVSQYYYVPPTSSNLVTDCFNFNRIEDSFRELELSNLEYQRNIGLPYPPDIDALFTNSQRAAIALSSTCTVLDEVSRTTNGASPSVSQLYKKWSGSILGNEEGVEIESNYRKVFLHKVKRTKEESPAREEQYRKFHWLYSERSDKAIRIHSFNKEELREGVGDPEIIMAALDLSPNTNIFQNSALSFVYQALDEYPQYASLDLAQMFLHRAIESKNPLLLIIVENCLYHSDNLKNNPSLYNFLLESLDTPELEAPLINLLTEELFFSDIIESNPDVFLTAIDRLVEKWDCLEEDHPYAYVLCAYILWPTVSVSNSHLWERLDKKVRSLIEQTDKDSKYRDLLKE